MFPSVMTTESFLHDNKQSTAQQTECIQNGRPAETGTFVEEGEVVMDTTRESISVAVDVQTWPSCQHEYPDWLSAVHTIPSQVYIG